MRNSYRRKGGSIEPTNGKPKPIKTLRAKIKAARQRRELRKLELEERMLARQSELLGLHQGKRSSDALRQLFEGTDFDGTGLSSSWGQFVDPRESFPDSAFSPAPYNWISLPSDRQHGRQWPLWININQLGYFRQASRVLCATNAQAKGVLKNLTNYLIGTGFKYNAVLRGDYKPADDTAKDESGQLVAAVQSVIDTFLGEADPLNHMTPWNWRERESFRRVRRDGEVFLRLFRRATGRVDVRFIEPEQIRDPAGARLEEGWSYGIKHLTGFDEAGGHVEDVESITHYHAVYKADSGHGEVIPATDIVHIKNVDEDATVKRGMPDFVYDTLQAFQRAGKLQRNLSEGAMLQAAIAWIEQFENATKASVQSYVDDRQDSSTVDPLTGRTMSVEKMQPGTIPRIPKGKTFVDPPWNQGAGSQQAIVQGDLRQGLSAFCAPEYFSADASNANYASTAQAGAPFVKCAETDQTYFRSHFLRCVWEAVHWAIRCGKLPPNTLEVVTLQVEAPVILHKDPVQQAQTDQIYITLGVKSRQTTAMEQGYDPEAEQANNAEWQESNPQPAMPDMGGGPSMPPMPSRPTQEGKDASGHEHAADGRFGTGGGSSNGTKTKADHAALHAKADSLSDSMVKGGAALMAKAGAAGKAIKAIKAKTDLLRKKIESRYGPKQTRAIMASAVAISWGAFGAGAAAGSLVYVPVGVAAIPGIAIAEIYRQVRGKSGMKESEEEELSQEEIEAAAKELVAEVKAEWEKLSPG